MVEKESALNQAIAQLSDSAWQLLRDVHAGRRHDARSAAVEQLHQLAEIASCTGVDLNDVPAYRSTSTHWIAIKRLASAPAHTERTMQAG